MSLNAIQSTEVLLLSRMSNDNVLD